MKSKFLMIALLATAFSAAPAWAAWNGAALKTAATPDISTSSKPSNWNITMKILESVGGDAGPCTGGSGNADYCPTDDCFCYTYTGNVSGAAGNGTVTIYETFDEGGVFDEAASDCAPAYGDIEIDGSKDLESIAFTGADCGSNAEIVAPFLNGGCQLTDSVKFSFVGLGTCGGTYDDEVTTKFTIKGKAE
jgi:hypothetical protein